MKLFEKGIAGDLSGCNPVKGRSGLPIWSKHCFKTHTFCTLGIIKINTACNDEYCSVIFRLIRDNFNFPVFKANEQITKYAQRCLEKMWKYASQIKEKAFLSILNQNFPEGACPRSPPSSLDPTGPSYTPFGCNACNYHSNGCTKFYWEPCYLFCDSSSE